ncbi:hypothetical protein R1sor_015346 [Riccia sorocarpa]|uniref:starch synthase n=1 Tax=Riccia sorocarpa TaxID=122646 RepID=A0ABD3HEZ5_9MARC
MEAGIGRVAFSSAIGVVGSTLAVGENDGRNLCGSTSTSGILGFTSSSVLGSNRFVRVVPIHNLGRRQQQNMTGTNVKFVLQNSSCNAAVASGSGRGFSLSKELPCKKNSRGSVRMQAEVGGSGGGNPQRETVQATLEQSKRLMAMQKELLKQIDERKKLFTELSEKPGSAVQREAIKEADTAVQNKLEETEAIKSGGEPTHKIDGDKNNKTTGDEKRKEKGKIPGARPLAASWQSPAVPRPSPPSSSAAATSPPTKPVVRSPVETFTPHVSASPLAPPPKPFSSPAPSPMARHSVFVPPKLPEKEAAEVTEKGAQLEQDGVEKEAEVPPPLAGPNVMNVVIVAAECAPWSKTGGLGDVVGALPKALARRGHRVMVVAPRYSNYLEAWDTTVRRSYTVDGRGMEIGYFHGYIDGVDFVFVDSPMFHAFQSNIYGGSREEVLTRMILLCKAAVEAPWHVPCGGVPYGDGNLVFIANDWHTALLPVYLQAYYRERGLMEFTRAVLVIHNMAHQGRGPMSDFQKLGLPDHYQSKFRLVDPIGGEHCNVFKAGLISAHRIVTVSHGYAWEVQTLEGGWGLHGVIGEHSWKLRGVVNGIDEQEWNPETDPCLQADGYQNFSVEDLKGKAACKAALQNELGLPVRSDVPLIGFIGRLDHQKGVDIIAEAMPWMMSQDLQLVMLGTGRPDLENMLRTFEHHHREKVRGWVGFSVKTAHRITAGCDILLMPSRFEPCGLNQLYAMKYGTVPVVHAVGGLKDTVQAFDPFTESGLGWTFDQANGQGLIHALGNAMWTFRDFKESWHGIQTRGMKQDLSWDNAAQLYEEVLLAAKYQW